MGPPKPRWCWLVACNSWCDFPFPGVPVWAPQLAWDTVLYRDAAAAGTLCRGALRFPRSGHLAGPLPSTTHPLRFPTLLCLLWEAAQKRTNSSWVVACVSPTPEDFSAMAWPGLPLQAGSESFPLKLPFSSPVPSAETFSS